jgi:hypothetical protein
MEKGMPHVAVELECPVLQKKEEVGFDVNVFRSPGHGGLLVTECSEFLKDQGLVTCGQACVHTQEARELHEKETQIHREELHKIGPDVIG